MFKSSALREGDANKKQPLALPAHRRANTKIHGNCRKTLPSGCPG